MNRWFECSEHHQISLTDVFASPGGSADFRIAEIPRRL